jgi:hypothetical protein
MLRTCRVILGMALLLAMMVDSSGQSRQEPPRQNPGGTQQRTNTEQRDTDQVPPSIIKKLPAEDIQQKPAADEQKGPDNRSDTWALSDKIAVIASIVALLQFFALVGTLFVLMSTARRQLRAYVLISSAQIHDFGIEHPPRVEVIIKNSGQTPAFDLLSWGGMIIEKFPLNIELALPPPDIKQSQTAQGPGDSSSHSITAGRPLTKIETDVVIAGGMAIYVFGEIKYKDIFKTERSTRFRMMYGGGGGAAPDGALTFCEEGNDAN